ncbi:abortive infection family protein [Nocardia sp. NPDC055321]
MTTTRSRCSRPPAASERAVGLARELCARLSAAATGAGDRDERQYRRERLELNAILRRAGIDNPFRWTSLEQGVAVGRLRDTYAERKAFYDKLTGQLLDQLQRRIDDDAAGDVVAVVRELGDTAGQALDAPQELRAELRRIEAALDSDPAVAIGRAKNLLEATAKAVLTARGEDFAPTTTVAHLTTAAAKALGLDKRTAAAHDQKLAGLLGRLGAVAAGVIEYRNAAGEGHHHGHIPDQLELRHGRLAVRAATAWSAFMLDTLAALPPRS